MQVLGFMFAAVIAIGICYEWSKWRHLQKYRYVGYGWTLGWRNGNVVILTRLLRSPSGRAGVDIGSVILEYNGQVIAFASQNEFIDWTNNTYVPPRIGEFRSFKMNSWGQIREYTLAAEIIQGPIPIYPSLPEIHPSEQWRYRDSLRYCHKTGVIFSTRSLSNAAIDSVLY